MKLDYALLAAASIVLVGFLLNAVLRVALIPVASAIVSELSAWITSFLAISLIVGYVFALKIREGIKIHSIEEIVVFSSLGVMSLVMVWFANPLAYPAIKDSMESIFNTTGWTNSEWSAYSAILATVEVVIALVFGFIGLYVGSLVRKPKDA